VEAAFMLRVLGKKVVLKAGYTDILLFLLLNPNSTYENGIWASWSPMPAPVKWDLINIAGA
jgi:hypothetical protein